MRYFYKSNDNSGFLSLKSPLENTDGYTEITEEEFNTLTAPKQPTQEQLEKQARRKEIAQCKDRLKQLDYIGTKIATGRASVQDYSEEIAEMNRLADRINELEGN